MCTVGVLPSTHSFQHVGPRERPTTGCQVKESSHKASYEAGLGMIKDKMWLQDTHCHTPSTYILPACFLPSATKMFIRAAGGGEVISNYPLLLYTFFYFHIVCSQWILLIIFPCLFPLEYNICSLFKKTFLRK